jgi:hypothetical protein
VALILHAAGDNADARINVRGDGNAGFTRLGRPDRPGWNVFDGAWHLVAYTWQAGAADAVYVDGQPVATGNGGAVQTVYSDWQRGVLLGAGRSSANRDILSSLFEGAVDNLRIYNYRLDADSNAVFAQEYLDATGIAPCLTSTFEGHELNFDNTGASYCKVDLADFAKLAENWLAGGLYAAP